MKGLLTLLPQSLSDIEALGVRNCGELAACPCLQGMSSRCLEVEALQEHERPLAEVHNRLIERLQSPASSVNADELNDFINQEKAQVKDADQDVKDAQRRIRAVKPKQKRTRRNEDRDESGSEGAETD